MDLKELAKDIVKDTVLSFTTKNGVFCYIEAKEYDYSEVNKKVKDFYSKYKSIYKPVNTKNTPPFCLLMHVLGVTDNLKTVSDFTNDEFIDCLCELYRVSGVTEIKKD